MSREELIDNLLVYKANLRDLDAVISNVLSSIGDYDDAGTLDEYTYTYDTADEVQEFIVNTVREYGILTTKHRLLEVDSDCEYYRIDDVDGTIYPRDYSDVEEWIDDILSTLDYNDNEDA